MAEASGLMSENEFREKFAKLDRLLKDVERHSGTIFSRGNKAAAVLPGGAGDAVHGALIKLRDGLAKFFEEIGKLLLNPGWPFGLLDAGKSWTENVGGPAGNLSAKVTVDQLHVDNHWKGAAATAYAGILPAQQKALEQIKAVSDQIDTQLSHLAYGIFATWVAIVVGLTEFVAQLLAEAVATGTIVGIPAAILAAIASTGGMLTIITVTVSAFAIFVGDVVSSTTSLNQTLHAGTGFPDGNWPKATASEFSDASLSDGDTTDWHIDTHE